MIFYIFVYIHILSYNNLLIIFISEIKDMASEEKKARDREIQQQNLFKARGAGPTQAETDMFRCGKVSINYYISQSQTFRSLAERMYSNFSFNNDHILSAEKEKPPIIKCR